MKTFYFHIVFLCLLFYSNTLSTQENLIPDPTIVYVNICEQGDENQYRSSEQIKDTLNTKDADNLMLYPNPTNEILYIEISNDEEIDYFFEIADLSGRIVLRENIRLTKTSIDVSKLAKGSYIYSIKNSEQIPLKTNKLIIM